MENEREEIKLEIDRLWSEVSKIREKERKCRNSPQKRTAIQLMRKLTRQGKGEKRWVKRKIAEVRLKLAELNYREGDYVSAHLQINKALLLCQEIDDQDSVDKLRGLEREINEALVVE